MNQLKTKDHTSNDWQLITRCNSHFWMAHKSEPYKALAWTMPSRPGDSCIRVPSQDLIIPVSTSIDVDELTRKGNDVLNEHSVLLPEETKQILIQRAMNYAVEMAQGAFEKDCQTLVRNPDAKFGVSF